MKRTELPHLQLLSKKKMKIHLLHALPNSFLPGPGQNLRAIGLDVADARRLIAECEIISHIRYPEHAARVGEELGADIPASGQLCKTPWELPNQLFLLCSLSPGATEIGYVRLYDGAAEQRDHDWRYEMTKFA